MQLINNLQKHLVLLIGIVLLGLGIFKPNLSFDNVSIVDTTPSVNVQKPDAEYLVFCEDITKSLKDGHSDRKKDGLLLANLYKDLAILISLDAEQMVVKNTEEIREANLLAAQFLKINLQDKYPGLRDACEKITASIIGTENVSLTSELRQKSVEVFNALSWACLQGSK